MKHSVKTEKYWHCLYCGKDQDASNTTCENCGKDLIINGEMKIRSTRTVPDNGGTGKFGKLFITAGVICGIAAAGFIGLMLIPYSDGGDTTKLTSPVQTTVYADTDLKSALLGIWTDSDGEIYYEFLSGGNLNYTNANFSVPLLGTDEPQTVTAKGFYTLNGNRLKTKVQVGYSLLDFEYTISVKNGKLTMTDKDNNTYIYKKNPLRS